MDVSSERFYPMFVVILPTTVLYRLLASVTHPALSASSQASSSPAHPAPVKSVNSVPSIELRPGLLDL